jgi:hypothetical protein
MANHRGLYIPYFSLTNWISDHTDCVDFAKILNDLHYVASKCFYDAEDFKAGMLSYCIDEVSADSVGRVAYRCLGEPPLVAAVCGGFSALDQCISALT